MTSSGFILVMYIIVTMDIFIAKQPEIKLTPVDNKGHDKYNRK